MSNEVGIWAVFEDEKCVNVILATPSVIEDFQQTNPETGYILANSYGLEKGNTLQIGDFREKQEDGSYKYFRNEIVGVNEQGEFIYVTRELIYLGE